MQTHTYTHPNKRIQIRKCSGKLGNSMYLLLSALLQIYPFNVDQ